MDCFVSTAVKSVIMLISLYPHLSDSDRIIVGGFIDAGHHIGAIEIAKLAGPNFQDLILCHW